MSSETPKYSLIDIETTGSYRKGHRIIEIAIINIDGHEIVEEFSTLINPCVPIPFFITSLTGIKNEDVQGAPQFFEVAKKIILMTEGRIFVAHNVFFDFNFMRHEFSELGYSYSRAKLCTVQLARKYLPGHHSYSLGELCKDLGISNIARHRALGDARATFELFKHIMTRTNVNGIELIGERSLALPSQLKRENYENLPQSIGVYYFYDGAGNILYIGKSRNIKKRVAQHLHPDLKRKRDIELKNIIAKIEFKLIPDELASLLFECHEIKKYRPPYNKALKRLKFPYGLELKINKDGFKEIIYRHNDGTIPPAFLVKSKRVAQMKIEHLYKNILGTFLNEFEKQKKISLLLSKMGYESFNILMHKIFYQKIPRIESFYLHFRPDRPDVGWIRVLEGNPVEIYFNFHGRHTSLELKSDPEMISILYNSIQKKDYRLVEIAHKEDSDLVGDDFI